MADDSDVPGLVLIPDWLTRDEADRLLAAVDASAWSDTLRRRVQHYGRRYDYGSRGVSGDAAEVPPLPDWAGSPARRLVAEGHMAAPAQQVIVNEYLPGQGISAHIDSVTGFGPVVAAVSLGSDCVMDFTLKGTGRRVEVPLTARGLTVMTGPARFEWHHAIAARKSDPGPAGRTARRRRVSVTFRTLARPDRDRGRGSVVDQ